MNRDTQSILLILVGGAILRISYGEVYLRYVKESLQPFLLLSGAALVLLGLASLVRDNRRGAPRRGPAGAGAALPPTAGHDGHDHSHGPRVGWLLLLPVLAIFLVAPPALGSYAAGREEAEYAEPEELPSFSALAEPAAGVDWVPLSLTNYYTRAVWDDGASLADNPIRLTGFVTPRPAGGFYLTRLRISCCAADAQSIQVVVVSNTPAPATDTWVAVTGTYAPAMSHPEEGYDEPVIMADTLEVIPAPADPYEI